MSGTGKLRVVLTTLTAKFIHSSLSLRYLSAACRGLPVDLVVQEYHINLPPLSVLSGIYEAEPDVVGFSCYIWNITQTLELADMLKKVRPECRIVLGGPEVSYDPEEVLRDNPQVDYIIAGEGEEAFPLLLRHLINAGGSRVRQVSASGSGPSSRTGESTVDPEDIPGLCRRLTGGTVKTSPPAVVECLEHVPSPYSQRGLENLDNKLVYVESSRGCPFSCQYCLSSRTRRVRYFPMERVKADVRKLVEQGCRQVKFVDRTFNCHKQRALKLWRYLRDLPGDSVFHFEIAADLLDEEMLAFLDTVPPGKFQFEIGVQTTTLSALAAVRRRQDWNKLAAAVARLTAAGRVEIHLDLIAGLPEDSYAAFGEALDKVYQLKPARIQLGFLKVLKGSGLRERAGKLGLVHQSEPPYEILATPQMPYPDLARLKRIEQLVEYYYNSHRFDRTLDSLSRAYGGSVFKLFAALADFWHGRGLFGIGHKVTALYTHIAQFILANHPKQAACLEDLLLDFASREPAKEIPGCLGGPERDLKHADRQRYYQLIQSPAWLHCYLPHLSGVPGREVDKQVRIIAQYSTSGGGKFSWYLFDHSRTHPITGRAASMPVELEVL